MPDHQLLPLNKEGEERGFLYPVMDVIVSPNKDSHFPKNGKMIVPALIDTGSHLSLFPLKIFKQFETQKKLKGFVELFNYYSGFREECTSAYFDLEVCDYHYEFVTIYLTNNNYNYMILGMDFIIQNDFNINGNNFWFKKK